ncbi:MAG: GDP-D-mannose 3',5'-epimerase [Bacteroidia bacterium]|jgi:GDP-D-mannose 3',5'-epimerase
MISLNDFALMVAAIAGKRIGLRHTPGPEGVRGRNSDNRFVDEVLGWKPSQPLVVGVEKTYAWISQQVN